MKSLLSIIIFASSLTAFASERMIQDQVSVLNYNTEDSITEKNDVSVLFSQNGFYDICRWSETDATIWVLYNAAFSREEVVAKIAKLENGKECVALAKIVR